MKLIACAVFNKQYQRVEAVYTAPTVGLIIRNNAPVLARTLPHFEEDLELREIGSFTDDNLRFEALPVPVSHSWDEYKKPEIDLTKEKTEKPVN